MTLSPSNGESDTTTATASSAGNDSGVTGALMKPGNGPPWPARDKPRPDILSLTPRPVDLLYALRRRWKWAVGLGLLSAVLALAIAWLIVPVNYTATAWLRIANKSYIIFDQSREDDLLNHRNAQATLMTSKFVLNAALRKPGIAQQPDIRDERDPVTWLQRNIKVSFPGRSEILQIAMTGEDPSQLVKLVNAVKDAYMEEVVAVERESHLRRKRVLEQSYLRNLEQIKKKTYLFRELADQLGTSDSDAARQRQIHALDTLTTLRDRVNELRGRIGGMDRKVAILKARLSKFGDRAEGEAEQLDEDALVQRLLESALAQDPGIAQARNQMIALEQAIFQEKLLAAHSKVSSIVRLEEQLEGLKQQALRRREEIAPQLEEQIREYIASGAQVKPVTFRDQVLAEIENTELEKGVLESELKVAEETFTEAATEAEKLGQYSAELETKRIELERLKKITGKMGNELQQWEIELAAAPRVTLLEAASVPRSSDIDKKYRIVAFIGLAAFGVVLFGVAALDFLARRVNSPSEVAYGLGVRVMGDVPLISGRVRRHRRTLNGTAPTPREGMLAESIDNIRTALLHRASADSIQSVMVTSSLEKEGKTTIASQLAASLARSGRRTLLMDGDLRRPTAHRLFELPVGPGLSELLRSEVEVEEVVRPTRVAGLWMLPAGKCDPDAVQSLARNGFRDAFDQLKNEFDFIVVDTGPVLTDADALLFGQYADAVILSVLRDVSRVPRVFEACERLRAVDIRLLGAVVNGMSMGRYYRSYYRPYTIRVESSA